MPDPDSPKHPAKFSDPILVAMRAAVADEAKRLARPPRLLDLFAGTGKIHQLADIADTVGVELRPRWAAMHQRTRVGDATRLNSRWSSRFDIVATSPCYGNRYSDHHDAKDGSTRRSYHHDYGEPDWSHPADAAVLRFGPAYKALHEKAWRQVHRVLVDDGLFLLNVSNFVNDKRVVLVAEWHIATVARIGFEYVDAVPIPTRRMRFGANADAKREERASENNRVGHELLVAFRKVAA